MTESARKSMYIWQPTPSPLEVTQISFINHIFFLYHFYRVWTTPSPSIDPSGEGLHGV